MADLLLSALLKKAADTTMQRIGEMWGINNQRDRLQNMLLEIQAKLPDAEAQANSNVAMKSWLENLKSAAYDADDLLDEFCYEELRRDAVRRGHKVENVSDFLSLVNPALFRYKMSEKLKKIMGRIDGIVVQMRSFGFVHHNQRIHVTGRVRTDSLVVESKVVGRYQDREKLVKLLLEVCDKTDLAVVSVVGMGGIGKTTLARLVYNDPRVKEHFKLSLWVCVSEEFNIGLLLKSIVELAKGDCNLPLDNMELLQRRLRQALAGKRYILVLDDVWNENDDLLEKLKDLLNCGDSGSTIIVTTRNKKVASIMSTVESYNLGCLNEEDSWTLFHRRAFSRGVKEHQELVEIGWKLVKNCQGLPLAINTLGSLMSVKAEVGEWWAILKESNIWGNRATNDKVLPELRLSYEHLPPSMKQCFAFCAVFPKDHVMEKEKLIQYWMANGFIPSGGTSNLEVTGNDIFNELAWRSFFQDIEKVSDDRWSNIQDIKSWVTDDRWPFFKSMDGHLSKITCKMHDLMHDLAQSIMGGECLSLWQLPAQPTQPKITVRHISLQNTPLDINNAMNCYPCVRSLILHHDFDSRYVQNIGFVKSNALRILNLNSKMAVERTTVTPEKMKHLRYLDFSYSDYITSLSEQISTLYLLQTLRLTYCRYLGKLPEGMQYMSSLRHLYTDNCYSLRSMPSGLGQLRFMQTLTQYMIGTDAHNGIGELENLDLHGKLCLYNLKEVRGAADARKANLICKHNLNELMLCWGKHSSVYPFNYEFPQTNATEVSNQFEVLDALKPCSKLKILQIILYNGDKFSLWITESQILENLIELHIIECRECMNIPSVEKLPFLQILKLEYLSKLSYLCNNSSTSAEGGGDAQIAFPSLKCLKLSEMPNLRRWWKGEVWDETSLVFPQLIELVIENCPKLTTLPNVPLLKKLSIKANTTLSRIAARLTTVQQLSLGSQYKEAENTGESLSFEPWKSLVTLRLTGYHNIAPVETNEGDIRVIATECRLLSFTSCNIFSNISSNISLLFWKCFSFIQVLLISKCNSLIYWPEEELRCLNCLKSIMVNNCRNFIGSQLESSVGRSITVVLLPKLKHLDIQYCPNLIVIPKCSTSIINLVISNCPKLEYLPEWLGSMIALKELTIKSCKSLNSLPLSIGGLTNLEVLRIGECSYLRDLPEGMERLKALEVLMIEKCPKIKVLPQGLLQQLTNLDRLWIQGCPHLEKHFRKFGKYRRLICDIRAINIGGQVKSGILTEFEYIL